MKLIERSEIQDLTAYEKVRSETRLAVIKLRSLRRIQAGEQLSLVFENRETLLYQIHEMVRAERMVEDAAIQHEVDTYNVLIPGERQLSATLFLEVADPARIKADLETFLGLDRGDHVWFDLGEAGPVRAEFEEGHSEAGRISAVHYVRFSFTEEQRAWFVEEARSVALVVEHPNHHYRVAVEGETRTSLSADLLA